MNCFDTIIFFCKIEDWASESQQYNFPAYGSFRVKSHIKIALEDCPCVVGDVNPVCDLVNKRDKMSVRAGPSSRPWAGLFHRTLHPLDTGKGTKGEDEGGFNLICVK